MCSIWSLLLHISWPVLCSFLGVDFKVSFGGLGGFGRPLYVFFWCLLCLLSFLDLVGIREVGLMPFMGCGF